MAVSPARKAAFDVLLAVERGRAHADELLRGKAVSELAAPDRHLATALVLGVLRWQAPLDLLTRKFLDRPDAKLDPEVRIALRLGALQLLHMERIPAHAAIDESVELAKQAGHRFAARMVNAVLRKVASAPRSSNDADPMGAFPAWMSERWTRTYGADGARAICAYGQLEPRKALRVLDPAVGDEFGNEGVEVAAGLLMRSAMIVTRGEVVATAAFREGRVRFQDEGSQLIAEIAGRGQSILDVCAAPGGKTLILAERNPEAKIVAIEASPQRLARMRERLASLGDRVECRLGDAVEVVDREAYDLVLADVPCSGTGTLGRNPELRHRLQLADLPRQAERQMAILSAGIRAASRGGRVVYSTCSLEQEENEAVVGAILETHPEVRRISMSDRVAAIAAEGVLAEHAAERLGSCVTAEGYLRLLPGVFGTDGFFVALLEKVGD